jgi:hypothetical protein
MGKTTFKPSPEVSQKLLAVVFGAVDIDPTVGTPKDTRRDVNLAISRNDLK